MKNEKVAATSNVIMREIWRVGLHGVVLIGLGLVLIGGLADLPYSLQAVIAAQPMQMGGAAAGGVGLSLLTGGIWLTWRASRLYRSAASLALTSRAAVPTDADRFSDHQAICPEISGAEAKRVCRDLWRLEYDNRLLVGFAACLFLLGAWPALELEHRYPEFSGWAKILAYASPSLLVVHAAINFSRLKRMQLFARALGVIVERYEPIAKGGQQQRFDVPKKNPPSARPCEKQPDVELYKIAYLSGGAERVIDTVLATLVLDGSLTQTHGGTSFQWNFKQGRRLNSVEAALFGDRRSGCLERAKFFYLNCDADGVSFFDAEMKSLASNLEARGLVEKRTVPPPALLPFLGLVCAWIWRNILFTPDLMSLAFCAASCVFLGASVGSSKTWLRTEFGHEIFQTVERMLDSRSSTPCSPLLRVAAKGFDLRLIDRRVSPREGGFKINSRWAVSQTISSLLDIDKPSPRSGI